MRTRPATWSATLNELDTLDRIRAVIVKDTGGRLVRLRDVAEVRSGFKDQEVILRQGGDEGVEVRIFKEGDANTVRVAEGVRARLAALEDAVPAGLALATLFDQSQFIEGAISEVVRNAWEGGLLAILVIALFLRDRRCTAVVAMAIPVSVVATFFVMQQMGLSLNIMSLGGLALGVGMLLDDSIVVLEAIHRRHAGGEGARAAAVSGTVEVAGPVIASTLTTVAVFLPIVFVEGVAGQLFRDQALTVSISILASLGFSLALIPVLSSRGGDRARGRRRTAGDDRGTGAPRVAPRTWLARTRADVPAAAGRVRLHRGGGRRGARLPAGAAGGARPPGRRLHDGGRALRRFAGGRTRRDRRGNSSRRSRRASSTSTSISPRVPR